jgi:predicted Zn finger-like uncharacterized protein
MLLVCPGCKNKITLDDGTLPVGIFKVRCTGCGRTITAQFQDEPSPAPQPSTPAQAQPAPAITEKIKPVSASSETSEVSPVVQAFVKEQLGAAKKEILDAIQSLFQGASISQSDAVADPGSSKRALICSGDPLVTDTLASSLKGMGYLSDSCSSATESFKNLDFLYGVIVTDLAFPDDPEGGKKLIVRINSKKAVDRRQTFVVLISPTQKTLDGNAAFFSGVNLILNKADLNNFDSVVRRSQQDFQQMYSTFHRVSEEQ